VASRDRISIGKASRSGFVDRVTDRKASRSGFARSDSIGKANPTGLARSNFDRESQSECLFRQFDTVWEELDFSGKVGPTVFDKFDFRKTV
jgi:hypothetical protein